MIFYILFVCSVQTAPLTLQEVIDQAQRTFPLYQAASLEKDLAQSVELSALGGFDLSVKNKTTYIPIGYYDSFYSDTLIEKPTALWGTNVFAGYRFGNGDFAVYDGKQQTLNNGELRAGVQIPLWRNGPIDRRRANLKQAQLGQQLADYTIQQQQLELVRTVSHRYYTWLAAGQRFNIAQKILEVALQRNEGIAERIRLGDFAAIELTDNLRAIEQRKAQVALTERQLKQAAIELSLYLRDAQNNVYEPTAELLPTEFPELEVYSAEHLKRDVEQAQKNRPEIHRLNLQQQQTHVERDYAKNQMALGFDVQAVASKDFGTSMASRPDLNQAVFETSVMLDIPLQQRLMRGRRDTANVQAMRLNQQKQFAKDRVFADVKDAHSALSAALVRYQAIEAEVDYAKKLEESERVRFNQGDSHLLIVALREQQTYEAQLRQIDTLLDYFKATADLKFARAD